MEKSMKILMTLVALTISLNIFADDLITGNFKGKSIDKKETAHLIIKNADESGRAGSFLGLLVLNKKVRLYMIDKVEDKYGLFPLGTKSGLVGIDNQDPELTMSVVQEGGKKVMTLINTGTGEKLNKALVFKSTKDSRYRWLNSDAGTFRYKRVRRAAQVSTQNSENAASATFLIPAEANVPLENTYILRESHLKGIHVAYKDQTSGIGSIAQEKSDALAVYLKKGLKKFLVLVDDNHGVTTMKKRR